MKNILFLAAAAMIFAGCAASGGASAVNSKKCGSTEGFETCGTEIDKENFSTLLCILITQYLVHIPLNPEGYDCKCLH